jgi:CMP-2-keto-3-deoxyoctulosonic acid synthetase
VTLAIIQARVNSTRLPNKMLLPVNGRPLIWHAWTVTVQYFGHENTVVSCPANDVATLSGAIGERVRVYAHDGDEWDVLGRFFATAVAYEAKGRIVRITPDDFPIQPWREVTTFRRLRAAQSRVAPLAETSREHIGHIRGLWLKRFPKEINTPQDYKRIKELLG